MTGLAWVAASCFARSHVPPQCSNVQCRSRKKCMLCGQKPTYNPPHYPALACLAVHMPEAVLRANANVLNYVKSEQSPAAAAELAASTHRQLRMSP
jgi:hypothetical protein